ncbi:hypothetical protein GCM10017690_08260 [Microbacterium terregens]
MLGMPATVGGDDSISSYQADVSESVLAGTPILSVFLPIPSWPGVRGHNGGMTFLPDALYTEIEHSMPIACVDFVLVSEYSVF